MVLRIATAGSVDDGKSTLIGRLLHDTKTVFEDQLASVEKASLRYGDGSLNLALLTDGLRAEREQGITIDVAYRYFATPRRTFVVADTPGHAQYTRNMVTGASVSDVAIVLVDARNGLTEQTRRHLFVASLLGVKQVMLAVNKMDLVDFSRARYDEIVAAATQHATALPAPVTLNPLPISALLGDNVVDLGMVGDVAVGADGVVHIGFKLTIKGCPLRAQLKKDIESRLEVHPAVTKVVIDWGEMTADERTAVMTRARWNARENAADTAVPVNARVLAIASGKGGVGKSSVTVNLAAALAARGATVGVLDADIWGFSIPRMLGMPDRLQAERIEGRDKPMILPNERRVGEGLLKVVSTGMLVDDEGTA
ncbi:MAG: DUF59 domain-containing protein, partial [Acidimicrobiia bacterium]|nr:DUF59 domain-containing protein [Acidimicrobiia bacterium]